VTASRGEVDERGDAWLGELPVGVEGDELEGEATGVEACTAGAAGGAGWPAIAAALPLAS
jgi:hypothetical protein